MNYKELVAWQKAVRLIAEVYKVIATFPSEEKYELGKQLRQAVVSVASNIAEGQGRGSTADFMRFLYIARGSHRKSIPN